MALHVVVDEGLCQGHGVCESEAPELFEVGRDRRVAVLAEVVNASQRNAAEMAVKYCPTHALSMVEE